MMLSQELLDHFAATGEYQMEAVKELLEKQGISHSEEDIAARLVLHFHSFAITQKITTQILEQKKTLSEMGIKEQYAAAGWKGQPGGDPGDRITSRAVIESLINGNFQEIADESGIRKSIASKIQSAEYRVSNLREGKEVEIRENITRR